MNKTRLLSLLICVAAVFQASAITWKFGSFDPEKKTCRVTGWGGSQPASGKLTIPSSYTHTDGVTYSVNRISSNALNDLTEVTEITIPASVTNIGNTDFSDNLLARIWGVENFNNCPNLSKFKVDSSNPRFAATGAGLLVSKDLTKLFKVPADVNVEGGILTLSSKTEFVTDGSFKDCWSINTIVFPSGITEISRDAGFEDMEQLTAFSITGSAFAYSVVDGSLIDTIIKRLIAYPRMRTIRNLVVSYPINEINQKAFAKSKYLQSVKLPASLKIIGERAFWNSSVTKVEISSGLEKIYEEAFCKSKITEVTLPDTWHADGSHKRIFAGCENLKKITIKSEKTLLPAGFARDCPSLTKVVAEKGLSEVYSAAFKNCKSLTDFPFCADTRMYFDSIFVNTGFSDIKFKDGSAYSFALDNNMFINCRNLRSIDLSAIKSEGENRGALLVPANFVSNCLSLKEMRFPNRAFFTSFASDGTFCNIGPGVPVEKIVTGCFDVYVNNHIVRYYGPGNFSPAVYVKATRDGNADYDAPMAMMFETANGATVSPLFYCEAFKSPNSSYGLKNATYYVAGRCRANYSEAVENGADVREMFEIELLNSTEKRCAFVRITPAIPNTLITKVTFNGKTAVTPDNDGNAYSGIALSEVKEILVEYTVNGETMKTLYPVKAFSSSSVEDIAAASSLRITLKGKRIEIRGGEDTPSYRVYTPEGIMILEGAGEEIDLAGYASGIYVIEARNTSGKTIRKIHI